MITKSVSAFARRRFQRQNRISNILACPMRIPAGRRGYKELLMLLINTKKNTGADAGATRINFIYSQLFENRQLSREPYIAAGQHVEVRSARQPGCIERHRAIALCEASF